MKTLLVSIDSKFIHSNLAVRYIKSYCGDDFNIKIKEFTINQKIVLITDEILKENADLVCFSCYIWNIEIIKEIIYIIKTAKPSLKILFGGPEVSYEVNHVLYENPFVDYVIFGEGELTFYELLLNLSNAQFTLQNANFDDNSHMNNDSHIDNNLNIYDQICETDNEDNNNIKNIYNIDKVISNKSNFLSSIKGLAYRDKGEIIVNEPRPLLVNLDKIKSPFSNADDYKDKIVYYESSRGCPFRCSFCMSSIDKTVRTFSMERVKKDLLFILNAHARQIKFVDRTFNADYKRAMEIMQFIVDNNQVNSSIHFEVTAQIMNEEFLEFLAKMPTNMFQLEIGVQSLNENTLSEINRRTDIEKLFYVINRISDNGNMHMHLDLIAGLPYEDYISFIKSFNGVHNLYAEQLQLGFLKVLKGTKIYNDLKKHGICYNYKAPYEIIKNKYMSYEGILDLKKIEELVDKYYNEKYFVRTIKYIITKIYNKDAFSFYDDFRLFWEENCLYNVSHNRKSLYTILYNFMEQKSILTDDFKENLLIDFISSNPKEELISIFDRSIEDDLRVLKRHISKNKQFRIKYFDTDDMSIKILNNFRLIKIKESIKLFIYKEKTNIFDRCKVYDVTQFINEIIKRNEEN